MLWTNGRRLEFKVTSHAGFSSSHTATIIGNTTLEVEKWYYFSAIRSGDTLKLAINGKEDNVPIKFP